MAKHKVDRAAPEGADEAVLNLQQVDALATLKKKIEEGVEESEQAASEASAEQAPAQDAEEVASADAALLASSDTVFTSTASHTLVAQAGGGTTGGASGLPGWVVPVTAAGVGVAAIVVASDSDSGGGGDGGGQPVNPNVQSVTPDVTTVNESGDDNSVTFTIQTDGTGGVVNFEIVGLSANDIASTNNSSSNKITGTTEVDGSGRAFVTVILAADGVTEGEESFTLSVTGTAGSDAVVSAPVTVTDTSVGDPGGGDPTIVISDNAGDDNAIGEGQSVTFAFDASNIPAGANVAYTLSGDGFNAGDIASINGQTPPFQLGGFLTVQGDGTIAPLTIAVVNDGVVGGPENLTLTLRFNGALVGQSTVDIIDQGDAPVGGDPQNTLTIIEGEAADGVVLGLRGDQDIRIDFTNPARQITGLDLNGNGVIAEDGSENNIQDGNPALGGANIGGYTIVDAYARNPLNAGGNAATRDNENNFYGDINFDGTGFDGDGVSTDGNIFLGGLGADTALGGIGNDFLTGGGVGPLAGGTRDVLSGGRNGDFFFAEGSRLSDVDGDSLFVNGGSTSDDQAAGNNSAQDSDMFLGEFSDDDEPIVVRLQGQGGTATIGENGRIISDNGISIEIDEIEHYDASGNLYGFLDDINVIVGGRQAFESEHEVGTQNFGIGSSAQHDIEGSIANNILIGGFDNDIISGLEGNDLLFGGRFDFLNERGMVPNPNLQNIVNNGSDILLGGDGNDSIVFEADGGTIRGDADTRVVEAQAATGDTLYLTEYGLGRNPDDNSPVAAEDVTDDNTLRFDLQAGDGVANAAAAAEGGYRGYGGADSGSTADQSNYSAGGFRVDVTLMENFIATGMGAVDYRAAGSNTPELGFNNQQNLFQYDGNLDIRGSNGSNVLYSSSGDDTIEGREGDDFLSGGTGNDDFVFRLVVEAGTDAGDRGDGVDVIHRQTSAGLNLWARDEDGLGLFEQDFNAEDGTLTTVTNLSIDFTGTAFENPPLALDAFEITIGDERYVADLGGATFANLADLADAIAANLVDPDGNPDANVSVRVEGNAIIIEDNPGEGVQGREFDASPDGYLVDPVNVNNVILLTQPTANVVQSIDQDRLIYQSYEDRFDGEKTNDDTQNGSFISLGRDSYAEDLVAFFGEDGTRLAEDQSYTVVFDNLTTQDTVVVSVNGVDYTLTVGRFQDGSIVPNEDSAGGTDQPTIQANFLNRLAGFINSFNDTDTAAGQIGAVSDGISSITLSQVTYGDVNGVTGEQTVFMQSPVVDITNTSGGQPATATVTNNSQHEVFLLGFDGRDNNLNSENVLFLGDTGISRAIFETASNDGGVLNGTDAVVVDNNVSDLDSNGAATGNVPAAGFTAAFVNINTNAPLTPVNNFTVHGDDQLFAGDGDDVISAGTGDDRIIGGRGMDSVDGGIDLFSVRIETDPLGVLRVIELNLYEAIALRDAVSVADVPQQVLDRAPDMAGFVPGSLTPIQQTENGTTVDGLDTVEGLISFTDVLQFQQADFAPGSTFTVAVTEGDFVFNADRVFELRTGGSGEVRVFENGVQTGTTDFQEIEAVRTISGTGRADASGGQGRDTLDLSVISDTLSPIPGSIGVLYNLGANDYNSNSGPGRDLNDDALPNQSIVGGEIRYSSDDQDDADRASAGDMEQVYGLRVDGVENVTTGNGNDIIIVDEGNSNKDNVFMMGAGSDRVIYFERYGDAVSDGGNGNGEVDETTDFRVIVGAFAADPGITHFVEQTVGNNGQTVATDTLMGVQAITLEEESDTARSIREADFIDLMNLNGGVVNYLDGSGTHPYDDQPAFPFAAESVYDAAGNFLLTIENINELENVDGSAGNDTVLVADASVMANSTTSPRGDVILGNDQDSVLPTLTWIEFDEPLADRSIFNNVGQFTFDLMGGSDLVDYSDAGDNISLAVTRGTNVPQFVIVDASGNAMFDRDDFVMTGSTNDRVDQLDSVEQVIASQGDSILDLTGLQLLAGEQNFQIVYGGVNPGLSNTAIDRQGYDVNVNVGQANGASTNVRTYGEYRDLSDATSFTDTPLGSAAIDEVTAAWNRIEGGNNDERVLVGGDGSEAVIARLDEDMAFNLRGSQVTGTIGQGNSVQYGGYDLQAGGVTVNFGVSDGMGGFVGGFDPFDPNEDQGESGFVTLSATFSDLDGVALDGTHLIGSYTQDNQDAPGQLLIEAAVSGNDVIGLNNLLDGSTIIVGATGVGGSGEIRVIQAGTPDADGNPVDNIVVFTGFEVLMDDGESDNAYSFANLATAAATLELTDAVPLTNDHDAIVVNNTVFNAMGMGFNGAPVDTIDLGLINTAAGLGFNFDFDVLDVTGVTRPNLNLIGTTDVDDTTPGDDGEPQNDNLARLPLTTLGNFPAGSFVNGETDEVVLGDLALINDISEFESIVLTEASAAGGSTFVLNVDDGTLTQGGNVVTHDNVTVLSAGGLVLEGSFIRGGYVDAVTTDVVLTAVSEAAAAVLVGGSGNDTLTGGGGSDQLVGGLGADMLDGGVQAKVESYTLDITQLNVGPGTSIELDGLVLFAEGQAVEGITVAEDDPDAVGAAIIRIFNSGATYTLDPTPATPAPVETPNPFAPGGAFDFIESVTYDSLTNELLFTYDQAVGNSFDTMTLTGAVMNPDVVASGNPQLRTETFMLATLVAADDVQITDDLATTTLFVDGDTVEGVIVDVASAVDPIGADQIAAAILRIFNAGDTYDLNGVDTANPFAVGGALDYIESISYNAGNSVLTIVHSLASGDDRDITAVADQAELAVIPFDLGTTDTFVYLTAEDSTVDSMDVITGFTAAMGGDSINFAVVDADQNGASSAGTVTTVSIDTMDSYANLAAFLAEADLVFDTTVLAFVGATEADAASPTAWVALDANADGAFNADDDMVVALAGLSIDDLATFDFAQVVL